MYTYEWVPSYSIGSLSISLSGPKPKRNRCVADNSIDNSNPKCIRAQKKWVGIKCATQRRKLFSGGSGEEMKRKILYIQRPDCNISSPIFAPWRNMRMYICRYVMCIISMCGLMYNIQIAIMKLIIIHLINDFERVISLAVAKLQASVRSFA